jgi:hypothetical protein
VAQHLDIHPTQARLRPEGRRNQVRVDPEPAPPCGFIAAAVDLAMVNSAERHRELVAHFAAERPRLREPEMMGSRSRAPIDRWPEAVSPGERAVFCV